MKRSGDNGQPCLTPLPLLKKSVASPLIRTTNVDEVTQDITNHNFTLDRMKKIFKKHAKQEEFHADDLVLKWDMRNEDKGKHGKIYHLWTSAFRIDTYHGNNAYLLEELNKESTGGGHVNGRFLKHYLVQ
jgi:hypothetical protein